MKTSLISGWLISDRGYCILALGNCPPSFAQIAAHQADIDSYHFGEYSLTKSPGTKNIDRQFQVKVHACCR